LFPGDSVSTFQEFHARHLFLGEKAFESIPELDRHTAIRVLLGAVRDYKLPFIYGAVDKRELGKSIFATSESRDVAFQVCILGVEEWARVRNTGDVDTGQRLKLGDLILLIVDDSESELELKKQLKASFRKLRTKVTGVRSLPQMRIFNFHDAMYFGDSRDSLGIQMADLCGYFMSRHLRGPDPKGAEFFDLIKDQAICARPMPEAQMFGAILVNHAETDH